MHQVESLTGCKSETISRWLKRCFSTPDIWTKISAQILSKYKIKDAEIQALAGLVGGSTGGALSSRGRVTIFNQFFRPHQPRPRKIRTLNSGKSLTEQDTQAEMMVSDQPLSELKNIGQLDAKRAVSAKTKKLRAQLCERVEQVLGEAVILTSSGEFYRHEDDQRVNLWLRRVRSFDGKALALVEPKLTPLQKMIIEQIRNPNAQAHVYAKLEGSRGCRIGVGNPWPEKMNCTALAGGLGLIESVFIPPLKTIAAILKEGAFDKPSSQKKGKS